MGGVGGRLEEGEVVGEEVGFELGMTYSHKFR